MADHGAFGSYPTPSQNTLGGSFNGVVTTQHGVAGAIFRRAAVTVQNGGLSSSLNITIPSTVQVGDFLLIAVSTVGANTHTTPSGWTLVDTAVGVGTYGCRQSIFRRVAQSGDAGTVVACAVSASGNIIAVLLAYAGASSVTQYLSAVSGSDTTSLVAPTTTSTVNNSQVVEFFALVGTNVPALTYPFSQAADIATGYSTAGASQQAQAVAGAVGTHTATSSVTGSWVACTLVLDPTAVPNMSVDVFAGTIHVNGVRRSVALSNPVITASDPTNPRIDRIVADTAGAVTTVAGTPAGSPVAPVLPADRASIALVAVAANTTAILNANITDARVVPSIAVRRADFTDQGALSQYFSVVKPPPVAKIWNGSAWVLVPAP